MIRPSVCLVVGFMEVCLHEVYYMGFMEICPVRGVLHMSMIAAAKQIALQGAFGCMSVVSRGYAPNVVGALLLLFCFGSLQQARCRDPHATRGESPHNLADSGLIAVVWQQTVGLETGTARACRACAVRAHNIGWCAVHCWPTVGHGGSRHLFVHILNG